MEVGRNCPCPCGSGRKYKKCCFVDRRAVADPALEIRHFQEELESGMARYARRTFGPDVFAAALEEFVPAGVAFDPQGPDSQILFPWFFYDRRPKVGAGLGTERLGATIAELYLDSRAGGTSPRERAFVEAVGREPFSFYEVMVADPGKGLRMRDVLREVECAVEERSASRSVERGDILFARVIMFEGFGLLVGTGSVPLPPMQKEILLDLRRTLRTAFGEISRDLLDAIAPRLREIYFLVSDRVMNPLPPVLQNTDGELLLLQTLTYRTEGAEPAFNALKSLAIGWTEEDLLGEAVRDANGALKKVEFSWAKHGNRLHRSWDNTILGHIRIEGTRLEVSVNSAVRARRIRAQIGKRLGAAAVLQKTDVHETGDLWAQARSRDRSGGDERRLRRVENLKAPPEAEEALRRMIDAHWEDWLKNPVPALGGRTPLKAACDPEGREMVEAILLEAERAGRRFGSSGWRYDFTSLRQRLGLEPPAGPR